VKAVGFLGVRSLNSLKVETVHLLSCGPNNEHPNSQIKKLFNREVASAERHDMNYHT